MRLQSFGKYMFDEWRVIGEEIFFRVSSKVTKTKDMAIAGAVITIYCTLVLLPLKIFGGPPTNP